MPDMPGMAGLALPGDCMPDMPGVMSD
jgi:hypothetical protein